jgi:predicted O-methyltransferase YrrM
MILTEAVHDYLRALHSGADPVLDEMQRHAQRDGIPIVKPETGAFLEVIARATQAKRGIEVGTAIGVSTLHLARGGCHVTSFEIDETRHQSARAYLNQAGLSNKVDLRLQDATEGLKELKGPFDLAFVDGPKTLYSDHVDQLVPLIKQNGLLLVDNALMSGTVATNEPDEQWGAEQIQAMRELNERLLNHPDFEATVTPIGDGVTIAVRC